MEKDEFRRNAVDMIYLTACAINGRKPKQERIDRLDLPKLFEVCQKHILTACVAYALESASIKDNDFTQAKEKAIRKNIFLDAERMKILQKLEAEKIWYMPLKGALLHNWYPKLGMRQMSDNDILCDGTKMADVRDIFLSFDYVCEHFGHGNHDIYFKKPVLNFEMHSSLFNPQHIGNLNDYFKNVKKCLVKDENNEYGYHFRNEDFYIYITAHEYMHFTNFGTGVRSLVDSFVFLRKFKDALDWNYLHNEFGKLGIADFEAKKRELALTIFNNQNLSDEQKKMLDYYIFSGTYGTLENSIENRIQNIENGSRAKYLFHRLFPTMNQVKAFFPLFYRHKWLLPVLWIIYRPFHGLFVNRKKILAEVKYLAERKSR